AASFEHQACCPVARKCLFEFLNKLPEPVQRIVVEGQPSITDFALLLGETVFRPRHCPLFEMSHQPVYLISTPFLLPLTKIPPNLIVLGSAVLRRPLNICQCLREEPVSVVRLPTAGRVRTFIPNVLRQGMNCLPFCVEPAFIQVRSL